MDSQTTQKDIFFPKLQLECVNNMHRQYVNQINKENFQRTESEKQTRLIVVRLKLNLHPLQEILWLIFSLNSINSVWAILFNLSWLEFPQQQETSYVTRRQQLYLRKE